MYTQRKDCRICNGELELILNLGSVFPSNFVESSFGKLESVPLELVRCKKCGLVQLRHTTDLDSMYRQYWYKSGLNPKMVDSLRDVVDSILSYVALDEGDTIVDIGCNDGTMLAMFPDTINKVGFEPARNLSLAPLDFCNVFINDYFPSEAYTVKDAKVITAIAMFYDLEDPKTFVKEVKKALHPEGLFVVQFTDLLSMLDLTAFDNICHEHLEYYSLGVVHNLFTECGLEIIDLEYNDVNGGSARLYVAHTGYRPVNSTVQTALDYEQTKLRSGALEEFALNIAIAKNTLLDVLKTVEKPIAVLGASTKGNTLLQYFNLNSTIIDHAAEVNKDKFGLVTVGTNIPIISEKESLKSHPTAYLVLPWHFIDTFVKKLDSYLEGGGKLIVPLPKPAVYCKERGEVKWEYL